MQGSLLVHSGLVHSVVLVAILLSFSNLFIFHTNAVAEESRNISLFNNKAVLQANVKSKLSGAQSKSRQKSSSRAKKLSRRSGGDLNDELRLDSVEDFVLTSNNHRKLLSQYQGLSIYTKYFRDWAGFEEINDDESRAFTQKLLIYQSSKTITEFLETSPLKELYHDLLAGFKYYRDYTTVHVKRKGSGELKVSRSNQNTQGEQLLEFKIHTSVHSGIESRLSVGEHVTLSYDLLRQEPQIQYELDF